MPGNYRFATRVEQISFAIARDAAIQAPPLWASPLRPDAASTADANAPASATTPHPTAIMPMQQQPGDGHRPPHMEAADPDPHVGWFYGNLIMPIQEEEQVPQIHDQDVAAAMPIVPAAARNRACGIVQGAMVPFML